MKADRKAGYFQQQVDEKVSAGDVGGLVREHRGSLLGELEKKDDIKRRLEEASKFVPLDQLALSPQCGFASTEEGNILTEEEQWAKLRLAVEVARCQAVCPRRDDGGFAGAGQGLEDARVGIVGLVGDQPIGRHLRQQRVGAGQIVGLSRGQPKGHRIAERVDQRMDLGAQPAAATPDGLIVIFF